MFSKAIFKHLNEYLIAALALIILFLDIFNVTSDSILAEATLAVLALLIFFLIKLEKKIDKIAQVENIKGLIAFRQNRDQMPTLETTFAAATEEIIFWGSALHTVHDRSDLIRSKLQQGCQVKILMLDSRNEKNEPNPLIESYQKITRHVRFNDRLAVSRMEFEDIYNSLTPHLRELFEIRYFDAFPTGNYIVIDRNTQNGFIRVEPCIYGCYSHESPSFDIDSRTGTQLFKVICRAFDEVWSRSRVYTG